MKFVLRLLKGTHLLSTKPLKTKIIMRYSDINIHIYLNSYHNSNVRPPKKTQLHSQLPFNASAQLTAKVIKIASLPLLSCCSFNLKTLFEEIVENMCV